METTGLKEGAAYRHSLRGYHFEYIYVPLAYTKDEPVQVLTCYIPDASLCSCGHDLDFGFAALSELIAADPCSNLTPVQSTLVQHIQEFINTPVFAELRNLLADIGKLSKDDFSEAVRLNFLKFNEGKRYAKLSETTRSAMRELSGSTGATFSSVAALMDDLLDDSE